MKTATTIVKASKLDEKKVNSQVNYNIQLQLIFFVMGVLIGSFSSILNAFHQQSLGSAG